MSKRTRLCVLAAAVAPLFGLAVQPASAALMYWDINDTAAGASGGTTATGAWNTSTGTNWNTDSTGDAGGTVSAWVNAETAVFSAGTNATGSSTVTASATPTAAGVIIEEGTITLAGRVDVGTGTIELKTGTKLVQANSGGATGSGFTLTSGGKYAITGNATLQNTNAGVAGSFISSVGTIELSGGADLTVQYAVANTLSILQTASVISGTGDVIKTGAGVLAFASPSTYSGTTRINDGELRIRTGANRLPTGTALTITSPGILNLNSVVGAGLVGQQVASLAGTGRVGLGQNVLVVSGSASTTFSGTIEDIANAGASGTTAFQHNGLTKSGSGTLTLTGFNTFSGGTAATGTGGTVLTAGGLTVGAGGALSGPSANLTINGGTLTLNNPAQTVKNLSGTGGTLSLGNVHTLTTDPIASTSYAGAITGLGGFTKANALSGATLRTLTLTGNNTFAGITRINGGSILAAATVGQALGGTSAIELNSATSALVLGKSNQINDTASLSLNGGELDTGGFSEVAGTVKLVADSIFDMGAGASILAFANSSAQLWTGNLLKVYNWTGNDSVGGGTDQLIFGSDATGLSAAQLQKIVFFTDAGTTQVIGDTAILNNGEVVPMVPEPGSLTLLGLGAAGLLRRRRRS